MTTNTLKVLTFKGTSSSQLYNITTHLPAGSNIVLTTCRIDTTAASYTEKSVYLEIGNIIGTDNVINNDVENFYLDVVLFDNLVGTLNVSQYNPNVGFKTASSMNTQTRVSLRNPSTGAALGAELVYFFFQFQILAN